MSKLGEVWALVQRTVQILDRGWLRERLPENGVRLCPSESGAGVAAATGGDGASLAMVTASTKGMLPTVRFTSLVPTALARAGTAQRAVPANTLPTTSGGTDFYQGH